MKRVSANRNVPERHSGSLLYPDGISNISNAYLFTQRQPYTPATAREQPQLRESDIVPGGGGWNFKNTNSWMVGRSLKDRSRPESAVLGENDEQQAARKPTAFSCTTAAKWSSGARQKLVKYFEIAKTPTLSFNLYNTSQLSGLSVRPSAFV